MNLLRKTLLLGFGMISFLCSAEDTIPLDPYELKGLYKPRSPKRTAVHDPSIVVQKNNTTGAFSYYVFGSHMAVSQSSDWKNWTMVTSQNENSSLFGSLNSNGVVTKCPYTTAFQKHPSHTLSFLSGKDTLSKVFENFDATAWHTAIDHYTVAGNMWAPDVIYNPLMGKWCMYLSLNGSKWNSVIVLLTASQIRGPYVYQGPVVFSGFNVTDNPATSYQKSDLPLVLNTNTLPSRYQVGSKWGDYWPHCIDPCVFYDDQNRLWMCYGSWSGGIYMLQLDEQTGLRDYTVTYPISGSGKNVVSDPYFGKKIAGGYYVSGEGAYIEKIGAYYYLFLSYGFLDPNGGYEMRVFRSTAPDGPYLDGTSNNAIYTSYQMNYGPKANTNRGMKLMGNYQWDLMPVAELAQGHNSAVVHEDGNAYLIYHTKFNNGTFGHEVRVHQLFVNEKGWLCAAPYEYNGEKISHDSIAAREYCSVEDIVGEYQLIRHPYRTDYEKYVYSKPALLTLHADGRISGAHNGSWTVKEGTSYITLTIGGVNYYGCIIEQQIDYTDIHALCFTATNIAGLSLWGSKADSKAVVALNYDKLSTSFSNGSIISKDLQLPANTLLGGKITWHSSDTTLLTSEGKIHPGSENRSVCLTAHIAHGAYYTEKAYELSIKANPTGLLSIPLENTSDSFYYDLSGRRIEQAIKGMMYIRKGKKEIIR